ncbi:hypothetical protein C5167_001590 [Papaver somniferum]|uniref:Uncharacterized protein n=1 Tax=Papaver somniferum TaxID=3469 RepID=A0A4Y7KXB6_PAPSO|nr:uncharacterized protein LOC113309193 [Papaver somniferum]RZC77437.1 hypothetical protein C5167_001590 [Papaver somniferum]
MAFKPYKRTTFNDRPVMGNSNLLISTIDQSMIRDHLNSVPIKRQVVALINSADNNHVTAHQQSKFSNVSSSKAIRDIDLNAIPVNDDDVSDSSALTPPRSLETVLKNNSGPETKRLKLNSAGWRARSSHNNHYPALNNNNINNVRYFGLTNGATNIRGGGGGLSILSNSMMRNHFSDPASVENFFLMNYPNRSITSSVAVFGVRMSGPNPPSAPKRCQWCFTTYIPHCGEMDLMG